ncbi:AMP-binding protein [Pseudomaricurvus alkylphenolicus]|uniref:AMP-binding protein n=1 Tax=Pseudomaricurvus alkylphenolicus TaxID=1306991 RepID=UPI00142489F8|nr:AMP-binding protein [Pseudomaricurvus alkylphenolicus]NIB41568.1 AMP-binding protein [Pseudomaricurvus alkylphenolicus]
MTALAQSTAQLGQLPTPLERLYHHEQQRGGEIRFVQPYPDGHLENISWRESGDQIRRMAAYLKSLKLPEGSRIALLSANCAHWILADMAIWMAGHVSVPLYPVLTADSVRKIMDHSEAQVIFVGKLEDWDSMKAGIPEGTHTISLPLSPEGIQTRQQWQRVMEQTPPMSDSPVRSRDDLATIIYTSGTTGMPKGVMHSFATMATVGSLTGELYGNRQSDRMLSYLPLAHVAERAAIEINQLYAGFPVYFSNSLETFADDLRRARPTLFFAVPRIWTKLQQRVLEQVPEQKLKRLLKLPLVSRWVKRKLTRALGMDQVRIGVSGAAPLSTSLMDWYESLGITILEGYAMSENFAYSHSTRPGQSKIGFVGVPSPFVDCKISSQGEILIKSPTNMLGYYLQPELTAETIDTEGYLHTGDKGEIDSQNRLKITGRIKEIFKTSKGKYVAPAPIEDLLLRNTWLEQICVTGDNLPQPIALATLSAAAVERCSCPDFRQQLQQALQQLLKDTNSRLDKHEHLSALVLFRQLWTVDNNFMTPTLKVKRAVLEDVYRPQFDQWGRQGGAVVWADAM